MAVTLPAVFIRAAWAPYPVIAELTTANSINTSWTRMAAGQARLFVHQNDPQLRPDTLRFGNILSIESDNMPVWAGPLRTWPHVLSTGEYEISCSDLVSILDNRDMPQDMAVSFVTGWDQRIKNALTQANLRALTGVFLPSILETGPEIEVMQEGGQSVMSYLDQGNAETDYEWWVTVTADRAHLEAQLHIGHRQGEDLRNKVHLWNGVHYTEVQYKPDFSQVKQSMTMYQDFGALLAERLTVARVGPGGPYDLASVTESASPFALDTYQSLPPGIRNEKTEFSLMSQSQKQLSTATQRGLEYPLRASVQASISVNRLADWQRLRLGNRLTFHTDQGFQELTSALRISAMQVDWSRFEAILATEIG